MKIIKANAMGMCFGVRDAIDMAKHAAQERPVTVFGELVHNDFVMDDLRRRGVTVEKSIETIRNKDVIITAHGASQKMIREIEGRGHQVREATCPLVLRAHRIALHFVQAGFYPVIVGQPNHVEVRGITGDLAEFTVLSTEQDLPKLPSRTRYGVLAQTTQPLDRVKRLVNMIQIQFPEAEVRFADTVCKPTKDRQEAAVELAKSADVVVVIGGAHSNNTRELAATCNRFCAKVYHIQTVEDLCPEWFSAEDAVGITAGTSTPDDLIDAVEDRLNQWARDWHYSSKTLECV